MGIRDLTSGQIDSVYVVAELGINHNGSLMLAKELVHAAAEAGADAVKLQKRKVGEVFTATELGRTYQDWVGGGSTYGEYKRALELAWTSYHELVEQATKLNLELGITFFDRASADEFKREFSNYAFAGGGGGGGSVISVRLPSSRLDEYPACS